jgi:hypothetical protein
MISIAKIKISDEKIICLNEITLNTQFMNNTPLLVDENYNLLDNYNEYLGYLKNKNKTVPVIISSVMDNFYINEYLQAA